MLEEIFGRGKNEPMAELEKHSHVIAGAHQNGLLAFLSISLTCYAVSYIQR